MASLRNPLLRYSVIHACLSSKEKSHWPTEDLIARLREHDLPVSQRSLQSDIRSMREDERLAFFAPIEYSMQHRGYYYTDPAWSPQSLHITPLITREDMEILQLSASLLSGYQGTSFVNRFNSILNKALGSMRQKVDIPQVQEASPVYRSRVTHLETVHRAIEAKQAVDITLSLREEKIITLHPYFLKEVQQKLYVAGCVNATFIHVAVGLHQVRELRLSRVPYTPNALLDREKYFRFTYGAQPGVGKVEDIELLWPRNMLFMILDEPLHESQRMIEEREDAVVIGVKLVPTDELLDDLFAFGDGVDILQPHWLRIVWHELIRRAEGDVEIMRTEGE